MYEHKKIFILGMARSGYEVAKFLVAHHNSITINDKNENQEPEHIKELKDLGVNVVLGEHPEDLLDESFDYVIKNPGIRNDHFYVKKAQTYGIPIINEMEVAYRFLPPNVTIIGITGTNGKTTTSTLIYEFLKEEGLPVHLVGNMGIPLCSFLKKIKEGDILVDEVSVQQLCNLKDFKTNISVVTNLSEAHLDFVGTYETYQQLKKRIFAHHTKEDLAILNKEDKTLQQLTSDIDSTKKYFGHAAGNAYLKNDTIVYEGEAIISTKDIRLKGMHNYENIMAAILVAKQLNVSKESICNVLRTFKGVEHRLEYVKELNGRVFYNDSKATNNKSTEIALQTFQTPTIILMGGLDRKLSFEELYPFMTHVKQMICYGETKYILETFAKKHKIPVTVVNTLTEATKEAYRISEPGDTILLSPACASWDQYKKFEDRGDEFKKVVESLE